MHSASWAAISRSLNTVLYLPTNGAPMETRIFTALLGLFFLRASTTSEAIP